MKACALAVLTIAPLLAYDDPQLAVALKAQSDFERVEMVPRPSIPDIEICMQSQAAALAVSSPEEQSLLHYRKGYCAFAGAAATRDSLRFPAAIAEFDKAIETWPARVHKPSKRVPVEPVSVGLRVFASIARLEVAAEPSATDAARLEISSALESPVCNSSLMPASFCADVLSAGSQWLGWKALRDNQLDKASEYLSGNPSSGWSAWVQGRHDFADGRYGVAARQYANAIAQWKFIWQGDGPTFRQALGPRPQYASALSDWGAARMLAGDLPGSITTLDSAVQADPTNARPLFLRARAKELSGLKDAALADYNLASRTAFAAAQDLASGEAHLYRGIVLFRRNDFARAEEEFASALNFEMTPALLPDARAWRHLAAVAGGSCGLARQSLTLALAAVSPFFPQDEARSLAGACPTA